MSAQKPAERHAFLYGSESGVTFFKAIDCAQDSFYGCKVDIVLGADAVEMPSARGTQLNVRDSLRV